MDDPLESPPSEPRGGYLGVLDERAWSVVLATRAAARADALSRASVARVHIAPGDSPSVSLSTFVGASADGGDDDDTGGAEDVRGRNAGREQRGVSACAQLETKITNCGGSGDGEFEDDSAVLRRRREARLTELRARENTSAAVTSLKTAADLPAWANELPRSTLGVLLFWDDTRASAAFRRLWTAAALAAPAASHAPVSFAEIRTDAVSAHWDPMGSPTIALYREGATQRAVVCAHEEFAEFVGTVTAVGEDLSANDCGDEGDSADDDDQPTQLRSWLLHLSPHE